MNSEQKKLQKRLEREAKEAAAALATFEATVDPEAKAKASATVGEGEDLDKVRLARTKTVAKAGGSGLRRFGRAILDVSPRKIGHGVKAVIPTVSVSLKDDDEATPDAAIEATGSEKAVEVKTPAEV